MNLYLVVKTGDALDDKYIKDRFPNAVTLDEGHTWAVVTEAQSVREVERQLELSKSRPGLVFDGAVGAGYAPTHLIDEVKGLLSGDTVSHSAVASG